MAMSSHVVSHLAKVKQVLHLAAQRLVLVLGSLRLTLSDLKKKDHVTSVFNCRPT